MFIITDLKVRCARTTKLHAHSWQKKEPVSFILHGCYLLAENRVTTVDVTT